MSRGKNINMFLMEGDVTSSIKCTLSNWTGVIYKIPRTKLNSELIRQRQHLKYSGIYFLIGKSDKEDKNLVYVGQAGNRKNGEALLLRLLEHTKDGKMDFFNEVIVTIKHERDNIMDKANNFHLHILQLIKQDSIKLKAIPSRRLKD